jgi:hypothetical protein
MVGVEADISSKIQRINFTGKKLAKSLQFFTVRR